MTMSTPKELAGRCAVVTGATRGIGLAVAHALASEGAFVVMTGLDAARGEAAARGFTAAGNQACFVRADQGADDHWPGVIAAAEAAPGRFDILVLNAGVSPRGTIAGTSLEAFREVGRVNAKGVFLGLQHGVAAIRSHGQGGSVVLMASVIGKVGTPMRAAYCASKGGVRLMTKAAALELGPEKIRVNSVHPGLIRTDLLGDVEEAGAAAAVPLGRFGEPEEVARAVLYLASERSRFMTGAELVVDGGWIAQ